MTLSRAVLLLPFVAAAACTGKPPAEASPSSTPSTRATMAAHDTTIRGSLAASGTAAPLQEATLGTRLMGSVTDVFVHEGQRVHAGDVLARIDARDVNAKAAQAAAEVAQAEAVRDNARQQAGRMRSLYADSAAPRAQLDDAEAGLARADAAVQAARGAVAEVDAVRAYAEIRAPFDGTVVRRFVDPGAFVAPGAPVVAIQDASRLRLSVSVAPADVTGISPGAELHASIEGLAATAIVEGVVPASAGAMYTVNAIVGNVAGHFLAGSAGTLLLPRATRNGVVIPETALVREGDLTGVYVRGADGRAGLRWLQVSPLDGGRVEVLAGLRSGETIELPAKAVPEK